MRAAVAALVCVLCVGFAAPAMAGRDFDPDDLSTISRHDRPPESAWLLAWPLSSDDEAAADAALGRAMADLLGFSVFRHFAGGFGGGQGVLWRSESDAEPRPFREVKGELADAGVDLVLHGKYQRIGDDYLLLPKVTVLPDRSGEREQRLRWSASLEADGGVYSFSAGLTPRTFELPQVVVPGALVRAHVNSRGWVVCPRPSGPEGCARPSGTLTSGFGVDSFTDREGGMVVEIAPDRRSRRRRGFVFVPLGPETLDPMSHFVAGLVALHRSQYRLAITHFDEVATAPRATSEMRAHSELYGCLAGVRQSSTSEAYGCGDRIGRAEKENPYDSATAEYRVIELVKRVREVDEAHDAMKKEAVLRLFDLGLKDLNHRLGTAQRKVLTDFGKAAGLEQLRGDGVRFEIQEREGGESLELEPGLLRLDVEGADEEPSEASDYTELMDRVLKSRTVTKKDREGRVVQP